MTGPDAYREAVLQVQSGCDYGCPHPGCQHEMAYLARAQVYATLALTAATLVSGFLGLTPAGRHEWMRAIDEDYAAEHADEVTR